LWHARHTICPHAGCLLQGPSGCAAAEYAWRREPDGYLKQILTARVYRIAVETPLQDAKGLSKALGSSVWLKREDLQVRRLPAPPRSLEL
jgi:threonine dehydratase